MELAWMRERCQSDLDLQRLRHVERAIEIFASDVVNEIAVLGIPLENIGAHEIDEGRRVGDLTEEAPSRPHLHDLDAAIEEYAAVVEGLGADDTPAVAAACETPTDVVRKTLGSADARVRALGEEELHAGLTRGT